MIGERLFSDFKGVHKGGEFNALCNRKPVELFQKWTQMSAFWFLENEPSIPVLNSVKTSNILL